MRKTTIAGAALGLLLATTSLAQAETLKFLTWQLTEDTYGPWWEAVIAKFEETHPGDTVEATQIARQDFADTMMTQFAGGSPPDIVHLASFEYQPFAANGWLEDLGPWIDKAGLDLDGWAGQNLCTWEGSTRCINLQYFAYIMGVNTALLEEAGLEIPTGWDEFVAAARALTKDTDGDGITDAYGTGLHLASGNNYINDMLNFVLDAGGSWTTPEGKPAFDTPEMVAAIDHWATLIREGLVPADTTGGDARQLFVEGKVAMRIENPGLAGVIETSASEEMKPNLKLVPSPFDPPVGGASAVITMPSEIPDERKQKVWDFIAIATSPEMQELFSEVVGAPAPRPGSVTDAVLASTPEYGLVVEAMEKAAAAGVDRVPVGLETHYNELASIVREEIQRMIIENRTAEDTAATLQERVSALQ
jgi:multiple sugar transport system substrate-binding protein